MSAHNDIVISTKNLFKIYRLYNAPQDRLKEALHPRRRKYHKDFYALKDISLEIKRGEVIGIVGKNGSGKSTLLKIISKVLTPTNGEVMVKGKISSLLELGSGFNPELTGMENIFFYGTILGFSEDKIKSRLADIIEFADIGDFIYQPLKTYSSGMRARLAFAVAINVDPDILILDEVLAVGDALFRRKCYARMEQFFKGQKTVLFVSHSVSDVNELCTKAVLIDQGEIILEGPTKEVTTQYERLLFAKPQDQLMIRNAIKVFQFTENHNSDPSVITNNKTIPSIEQPNKSEARKEELARPSEIKNESKSYYLPDLISKSRLEYRNYNVDISNISIRNLHGKIVNVLIPGEEYELSYEVQFGIPAKGISFGMMFKTEKGMVLSGSTSHKSGLSLMDADEGQTICVKWKFVCNLLNGMYYTNIGILSFVEGERITLNRIVDALVFKVYNSDISNYNGLVFFNQQPEIILSSKHF